MVPIFALLASNYKVKDFSIKTNKKYSLSIFECDYMVSSLLVKFLQTDRASILGVRSLRKGGGGDQNRDVSHTKCQWYKNMRAEGAKLFQGPLEAYHPEIF